MRAEDIRPDLLPAGMLQKSRDHDQADQTPKEQDLKSRELGRKLASGDRHRHERYERTGHPECSPERGREAL